MREINENSTFYLQLALCFQRALEEWMEEKEKKEKKENKPDVLPAPYAQPPRPPMPNSTDRRY